MTLKTPVIFAFALISGLFWFLGKQASPGSKTTSSETSDHPPLLCEAGMDDVPRWIPNSLFKNRCIV